MRIVGGLSTDVGVKALIEQIEKNQKVHTKTYLKAIEGWRKEVTKVADKTKDLAIKGDLQRLPGAWRDVLDVPKNYSEEYENAIKMLQASTAIDIKLSQEQFNCLWLDDWGWKDSWVATSANYTSM